MTFKVFILVGEGGKHKEKKHSNIRLSMMTGMSSGQKFAGKVERVRERDGGERKRWRRKKPIEPSYAMCWFSLLNALLHPHTPKLFSLS